MYTVLTVVYGFKWFYESAPKFLQDAIEDDEIKGFKHPYNGNDDATYAYFGVDLDNVNTLEASKADDLKIIPTLQQAQDFAALWVQVPFEMQQIIKEENGSALPDVWIIPSTS